MYAIRSYYEEKLQGKMELFKMAVADRSSAREMYQNDSWLQKAFAIFFLLAWCALTFVMLNYFIFDTIQLDDWQIAFVSSINGGISTKLSTIIDFLFGGAISGVNEVKHPQRSKHGLGPAGDLPLSRHKQPRITSYNVCYTKLLRMQIPGNTHVGFPTSVALDVGLVAFMFDYSIK